MVGVDDCTRLIDELPDVILEARRDRYDAESGNHHNMIRRAKTCRCLRVRTKSRSLVERVPKWILSPDKRGSGQRPRGEALDQKLQGHA